MTDAGVFFVLFFGGLVSLVLLSWLLIIVIWAIQIIFYTVVIVLSGIFQWADQQ